MAKAAQNSLPILYWRNQLFRFVADALSLSEEYFPHLNSLRGVWMISETIAVSAKNNRLGFEMW